MSIRIVLAVLALLAGMPGWKSYKNIVPATVADQKPSYTEFVATHQFPFVASVERQSHLRLNYSRLALGLDKSKVMEILGEPDYSQTAHSKTTTPGYLGSSWTYYFEKPDSNLTNELKDKQIQVFFDINGKTDWIVSNVNGLKEMGKPSRKPANQAL